MSGMPQNHIYDCPPPGGVLSPKTDGGVPLATENWTPKDWGKMEFGAKNIEFCKDR